MDFLDVQFKRSYAEWAQVEEGETYANAMNPCRCRGNDCECPYAIVADGTGTGLNSSSGVIGVPPYAPPEQKTSPAPPYKRIFLSSTLTGVGPLKKLLEEYVCMFA